jgi:hypothetical protein
VEGYNNCWNERVGRKSSSWGCFLGNIEDAARDSVKYIADVSFILKIFSILIYEVFYTKIDILFQFKAGRRLSLPRKLYDTNNRTIYGHVKAFKENCSGQRLMEYVAKMSYLSMMPEETGWSDTDHDEEETEY